MKTLREKLGVHNREDAKNLFFQVIKFSVVGLANTVVSLGVYYVVVLIDKNQYMLGNILGFFVSVANAFFWNHRYVFRAEYNGKQGPWLRIWRPLIRTYLAYGATFLLSTVLLYAQVNWLGVSAFIAPVLNLILTIPLNFLVNKFWTFK